MKTQTAVEWLVNELIKNKFIAECGAFTNELVEKAKEIEKQQMNSDTKKYSNADLLNALHSLELEDNKNYSNIYDGIKKWYYSKMQ